MTGALDPQGAGEIHWDRLRAAAREAARRAYAPYSGLRVGAAALTETGAIVVGCNVENASLGLTLCAECALVGAARIEGATSLVAVSCISPDADQILQPCGRCRQILFEMGGHDLLVDGEHGPLPLEELLPRAFGPDDLP